MTYATAGRMYATDVADIGEGATYSTASNEIDTSTVKCVTLLPYATGANASSAGTVTINLKAMVGGKWSTAVWQSITVTVAAAAEIVSAPTMLNCPGIQAIKVSSIVNGDATYHITNVNVAFSATRFFE
jgi:hypothetical protein